MPTTRLTPLGLPGASFQDDLPPLSSSSSSVSGESSSSSTAIRSSSSSEVLVASSSSSSSVLAGSSSSAIPPVPTWAFDKDCAPRVEEIGKYNLVTNCDFPVPPDVINIPDEIPPPTPPIDIGCFSLTFSGHIYTPNNSEPFEGIWNSITYPEPCVPDIDLGISLPCFVTFKDADVQVAYDPYKGSATGAIETTGTDDCDLGINLSIGLPCPTGLTGGTGNIIWDISAEQGEIEIRADNLIEMISSSSFITCDYALNLDIRMPCPTVITGGTGTARYEPGEEPSVDININSAGDCDYEINLDVVLPCPVAFESTSTVYGAETQCVLPERRPTISLTFERPDPLSCDFAYDLSVNIPCQVVWQKPKTIVNRIASVGDPTAKLEVNPISSSTCQADCNPKLQLLMNFPCPVEMTPGRLFMNYSTHADDERPWRPWAVDPYVDAQIMLSYPMSFSNIEMCRPILNLSLKLPCPVDIGTGSVPQPVGYMDSFFYTEEVESLPERSWAFGGPTVELSLSMGKIAGVETPCLPILDLSLNMPCPTGGVHREPDWTNPDESLLVTMRQSVYESLDINAAMHPYYSLIPGGSLYINRNLDWFRDEENWDDPDESLGPEYARGNFSKLEFNSLCELDMDISLYIPCGRRVPDVNFYHYSDYGQGNPTPLSGWSAVVYQDWAEGEFDGDCAFNEEMNLYITPGEGGGGKFALITGRAGTDPPYMYTGVQAQMVELGSWESVESGASYEPIYNIEEQGCGGEWVNPLLLGDVVVIYDSPIAGYSTPAYACIRAHYRGTY